jgi:hypothetical protein
MRALTLKSGLRSSHRTGLPNSLTRPASGHELGQMRIVVVFPAPFGPRNP